MDSPHEEPSILDSIRHYLLDDYCYSFSEALESFASDCKSVTNFSDPKTEVSVQKVEDTLEKRRYREIRQRPLRGFDPKLLNSTKPVGICEAMANFDNSTIPRLENDYGITREILEQQFGKTLEDAAKNLRVSRSTLKRICREYDIPRWPHHKTRKISHHVNQGVSLQSDETYMGDQQCRGVSQENRTDHLAHKKSLAIGKCCDGVMSTVKVAYRGDIIKFQLSPSSTRAELEVEVEKRHNISLQSFSIKYQDEDDDWILITSDSDLRDSMHSLRLLGRTTLKLLVTPKSETESFPK